MALLSLALGIGANTAIFSVMDAFLLRMLPVRDPQHLVVFDPIYEGRSNSALLPFPMYERLRKLDAFFSDMTAIFSVDRSPVTIHGAGGGTDPEQCRVGVVTGSFFETLGVSAAVGRTFDPEDDVGVGGHPVAVISYTYWERKFAHDPHVVGRTFTLGATPYEVVGVTPRGFSGEWVGRPTDFWVPVAMMSQVMIEAPPDPARGGRMGKLLVVSQVALSVFLLVGAGLFVRTLRSLKSQDLGFDRTHLVMAWIAPGQTGRWGAATARLYGEIEQRLSAIPGVTAVSPNVYGMLQGNTNPGTTINIPGYTPASDADARAQWSIVGTGFFDTMGLRLIAGRNLTDLDTATSTQVTILNQSMARHFFGNENPLGKRIESWGVVKEVVGVVSDAKYESPREEGQRMFYLPYRQQLGRLTQNVSVAIRTSGNPERFESTIRRALSEVDPRLPVLRIETVEDQLDALLVPERATATFSMFFGALAALLAAIGLYGLMAYNTARRTNEIGVRLAMGASRRGILGMVMRETLGLVACGILLGVPAALAGGRMISARLFGVRATDPLTIAVASLLMIGAAGLAGFLPAQRAAKVDPMAALRHE